MLRISFVVASLLCACLITGCPSAPADPQGATPASGPEGGEGSAAPASMPSDEGSSAAEGSAAAEAAAAEPAGHGSHGARPGPLAPGETGHYGAPFTSDEAPISLANALESCVDTGATCKVEATIERVCERAGCWFTLAAPDVPRTVRVNMRNYGFFVPRNTPGAHVVLEGSLAAVEIPQEVAQHYAEDEAAARGGEVEQVAGPQQAFQFTIDGAEITMASAQ